jgi:hypothetical protein
MPTEKLSFARFAVVGFGPLILATGALVCGLLLNGAIILASAMPASGADGLLFLLYAMGMAAVLVYSIRRAATLFNRGGAWFRGALVLYGFWLLPAMILSFFLSAALAGVSMAAVDGTAKEQALWMAKAQMVCQLIFFAHVVIIPWVSAAAWYLRRGMKEKHNIDQTPSSR